LKKVLLPIVIALFFVITFSSIIAYAQTNPTIPDWIKNNAAWWASGQIDDASFISGIKYLIENNIMIIDTGTTATSYPDRGDFYLVYDDKIDPSWQVYEDLVKSWGYFEEQVVFLNTMFVLPFDVAIVLTQCGESNAYWDGNVVICYELIDSTLFKFNFVFGEVSTPEQIEYSAVNVVDHVFYHEIGHAFIDLYNLPVTGMEEDVADQFSAFILGEFSKGVIGQDAIRDASIDYYLRADEYELQPSFFCRCTFPKHPEIL